MRYPVPQTRPLFVAPVPVVLGVFALGISSSVWWTVPAVYWYASGVLLGLVAVVVRFGIGERWALPASFGLLLVAAFLFGAGRMRDVQTPPRHDISLWNGFPSVWVQGRVTLPSQTDERSLSRFGLYVQKVWDGQQGWLANGNLLLTATPEAMPRPILPGETVWVRGRVMEPPPATNPGAFDYQAFLARKGVFALLHAKRERDVRPQPPAHVGDYARSFPWRIRTALTTQSYRHLPPEQAGLLNGLMLGERARIGPDLDEAFARTGTVHVLSVSGLHCATLAGALLFVLRAGNMARRKAALIALLVLWLFALACGGGAAVVRSSVMATLVLAAPLVRRAPASPLHGLYVAALLILMVEPGALWESGFQLSFVATGFLLLFWHPIAWRVLPSPPEAEPGLLPVMLRWCLVGLLVSMVATVGTLPLVAYHFNRVSLVSPLANIPIAGMTEALLLGGLTTSTLSVFLPPFFTGFLWLLLNGGLWLFTQLTLTFASVPFASLSVASPSVWFVIAYYAGLSVMAFWVRRLAWRQILFAPEK